MQLCMKYINSFARSGGLQSDDIFKYLRLSDCKIGKLVVLKGHFGQRSQEYPNTDMSITFLFDISNGTILCRKSKN